MLMSGKNQNCPFLKTDSLAYTFFWTKNFQTKCKMLWQKSFENVFDTQKNFFLDTFLEKKLKKNLENFLRAKIFSKLKKNVFSQKVF